MVKWTEEGVILSTKPHGESSLIVQLFIEKYTSNSIIEILN